MNVGSYPKPRRVAQRTAICPIGGSSPLKTSDFGTLLGLRVHDGSWEVFGFEGQKILKQKKQIHHSPPLSPKNHAFFPWRKNMFLWNHSTVNHDGVIPITMEVGCQNRFMSMTSRESDRYPLKGGTSVQPIR